MKVYGSIILNVVIAVHYVSSCGNDCSEQAGVPCSISTTPGRCPTAGSTLSSTASNFIPKLQVVSIPNGSEVAGINVTWKYETPESGEINGFMLEYTNIISGEEIECVFYNLTSPAKPANNTVFWHSCSESPTRMIRLAAFPGQSPYHYSHMITAGYTQAYDDSPACWQPPLVNIKNDSCSESVDVEIYLAPADLSFTEYKIVLESLGDYKSKNLILDVTPGEKNGRAYFENVLSGEYKIEIHPQPRDNGEDSDICYCSAANPGSCCSCYGTYCDPLNCVYSTTPAFTVQESHPTCYIESIPGSEKSTDPKSDTVLTIAVAVGVVVILVLVIVAVVFITFENISKLLKGWMHSDSEYTRSQRDNQSIISPPNTDACSGVMSNLTNSCSEQLANGNISMEMVKIHSTDSGIESNSMDPPMDPSVLILHKKVISKTKQDSDGFSV